ncbi:MAG TPA: hypothetical protein VK179_21305 [Bacteroidales bacterium]|nr:hypothetical protein [Bacteroidales bacterium]
MKYYKILILIIFNAGILTSSCERSKEEIEVMNGYIVGFAPCTIYNQYRIGYIIISDNEMDTLEVYNLSDDVFKMPASIITNQSDTLFKIPWTYFENYRSSAYFPNEARYQFKTRIYYRYAKENEKSIYWCTADVLFTSFTQIIVVKALKL